MDCLLLLARKNTTGTKVNQNNVITHVETPTALRGRGLAAVLMQGLVDDAERRGLQIVPVGLTYRRKTLFRGEAAEEAEPVGAELVKA